jgi:predicted AAA+ superfamily ATPase
MTEVQILARQAANLAYKRSREEPVILLEGPRSTGKSTVIRSLAKKFKIPVLDFDDQVLREEAERNPAVYTKSDSIILIDEYQRVPAILDAIKSRMNRSSRPGQFIITGSIRHTALAGSVQALTGRLHRMQIFPFAQAELAGISPLTLFRILEDAEGFIRKEKKRPKIKNLPAAEPPEFFVPKSSLVLKDVSPPARDDYIRRIVKGGFPLAVQRNGPARNRWFDDYIRQTVERDIPEIAKVRNKRGLSVLLRKLASQTAQILSLEKAAADTGIDIATARDYIQLLEDVFMIQMLPAWGRTLGSRTAAKPKIHFFDSGVAGRLLGLTEEKLGRREPAASTELGHLMETFTVAEIFKELSWLDDTFITGHWRTHDHKEVDFVIESMAGSVYGFEIKTGERLLADDFKGLAALRKFTGTSFAAGFALYAGASAYRFEEKLYALPISRLWE